MRLLYMDGLRAIALLCVVLFHCGNFVQGAERRSWLGLFLKEGCHGVDLFFVISGFCLAYPILSRRGVGKAVEFNLPRFAAQRMVRILPPYYGAILFFIAFALLLEHMGIALPAAMPQRPWSAQDVVRQALFLGTGDYAGYLNASFWTLAIEFRWYVLFPFILWVWIRSPYAFIFILGACTLLSSAPSPAQTDIATLPAFLFGIVAAEIRVRKIKIAHIALPAFLVLVFLGSILSRDAWINTVSSVWQAAALCFVVCAGEMPLLVRALSLRWLTAIGQVSYSMYLIHQPLITFMEGHGVGAPLTLLSVVTIGCFFWWLIERRCMARPFRERWGNALENGFRRLLKLEAAERGN